MIGDFHNFGRRVEPASIEGRSCIHKPRPVYWENFFFGVSSPLKKFFASHVQFELDTLSSNGLNDNYMKVIERAKDTALASRDWKAFGALLAYSYFFGIQDLHIDNVLVSPGRVQALDVEQVFSDLLLPSQTLMLPTHEAVRISAALNNLTKTAMQELPLSFARPLIDGFVDVASIFNSSHTIILAALDPSAEDFAKIPIRVFFRRTKDYIQHLNGEMDLPDLFQAEKEQLARRDIPYFFSYLGMQRFYNYTSADWKISEISVPEERLNLIDYACKPPAQLLSQKTVSNRFARGMLYLVKNMPSLQSDNLQWPLCSVNVRDGLATFDSQLLRAQSRITK